jgi:hypothetical protein
MASSLTLDTGQELPEETQSLDRRQGLTLPLGHCDTRSRTNSEPRSGMKSRIMSKLSGVKCEKQLSFIGSSIVCVFKDVKSGGPILYVLQ